MLQWTRRLKSALHPMLDPVLSLSDHRQARRILGHLPDGEYSVGVDVPYVSQFASPDRIYDYIHHAYDGTHDPQWASFGAPDPADYAFWAHRVCALACLKMAAQAYDPAVQPTLWELVQMGLVAKGYTVRDEQGRWVDEGWTYPALVSVGQRCGLHITGRGYVSPWSVCAAIHDGALVAASVTPELGERQPNRWRYGGHVVLVYGFGWQQGRPDYYVLHNPSGRFAELQAGARIPAARFAASFAHKMMVLRRAPSAHTLAADHHERPAARDMG